MENLKINCKTEKEKKEAIKLLIDLGNNDFDTTDKYLELVVHSDGDIQSIIDSEFNCEYKDYKEITLPELRDMVVLKRNDPSDATHENTVTGSKVYVGANSKYYFQDGIWNEYPCGVDIKPIQKEEVKMKEYLVKDCDNHYLMASDELSLVGISKENIIEIPEGSNVAWKDKSNGFVFFTKMEMGYRDATVIWQRESINDQVASAEQARQEQKQCKYSTVEIQESDLIFGVQGIMVESIPVGMMHHGFTQPEELPFVGDNAWNKQIGGDHYKKLAIQPMEYALQNKLDYAQANVVKYVTRHADKGGKDDLLKAIHNIELMIAHYYSDQG